MNQKREREGESTRGEHTSGVNRRKALSNMGKVALVGAAGVIVGGAGGYIAGSSQAGPGTTTTVTAPGGTQTITSTVTSTVIHTTLPTTTPVFKGEKVTLITWGGWLIESLIKEGVKQPTLLEFENDTGISVQAEVLDQESAQQKMMMDLTSHTGAYDLVCSSYYDVPTYAAAGYLRPIDDLIEKWSNPKYFSIADYFLPSLDSCKYRGKTWSLPMYEHCGGFTYRKDIFEKKGLKPPANMDELTELCKELNDPPNMYAIAMRGKRGNTSAGPLTGFAWAYGATWFEHKASTEDEIKSLKAKPTFTSPEFISAANKYVELLKNYAPPGVSTYDWYEVMRDFCAGKVAIALDADYGYWWALLNAEFDNPKEKVGIAIPPRGPGGEIFQWWWTFTHGINADSKHPEATFQVLQLLSSLQLAEALAKNGVAGIPRVSVMQSPWFAEKFGKEAQRVWVSLRGYAKPEFMPRFPESNVILVALGDAVSAAITGEKKIEDGLKEVQTIALETMTKAHYYD